MTFEINKKQKLAICSWLFILFGIVGSLFSQTASFDSFRTLSGANPNSLTICGESKTFTISVNNVSPFLLQNPKVTVVMPVGMNYEPTTVVGATLQSATSNTVVFQLTDIVTPTLNRIITFNTTANCDIIPFLTAGNVATNYIRMDYSRGGSNYYDAYTTASYTIKQPNLSITTITNQTYSGSVGNVFTRCITITNGGIGELSQFKLTDVHGNGLQVNAITGGGVWTNTGNTETINFSSVDFSTIGNGNNVFETGESITICESIKINNCTQAQSDYKASWGCNSQECQFSSMSGNITFPGLNPNLVVIPNNGNLDAPMNSCLGAGNASPQLLKVYNNGTGDAVNTQITIDNYPTYSQTNIDISSFTIQLGVLGTPTAVAISSFTTTSAVTCIPNSVRAAVVSIPLIQPNDTIYIKWNTYSCCVKNTSCSNGLVEVNGWDYRGKYDNICQNSYIIPFANGRYHSTIYAGLSNNNNPSTMNDGDVSKFGFTFTSYGFRFPRGTGLNWKFKFTIPSCLAYSGNLNIINSAGTNTWSPTSITTSGNVVTATYTTMPPFDLTQSVLSLDLTTNCAACNVNGASVGIEMTYSPNNSCNCETSVTCLNSGGIIVNCPSNCPEGIVFKKFDFRRFNYGLPDNEANGGDGVPDVAGVLDFNKVRTDRLMYKDTLSGNFMGTVKTSTTFPNWQYCYATTSITNGNLLSFVDANVKIYRGGILLASCSGLTPNITNAGTTKTFSYDISVENLGACLPIGFTYQNNDSIVLSPRYVVSSNTGGPIVTLNASTEFYMSPIVAPVNTADKYQCNFQAGSCAVIGFYYAVWGPDDKVVKSCDKINLTENFYLSVGPCCNNYYGGNLFPYEYRNWSYLNQIKITLPDSYELLASSVSFINTKGTGDAIGITRTLTPISNVANIITYNLQPLYSGYGGTVPLSDDGYMVTINYTVQPTCKIQQDISKVIRHEGVFTPIAPLSDINTIHASLNDFITYDGPEIIMQADLLSVNVPNDTTGWTLTLTNNSAADASNVWITAPTVAGVTALRLYDLGSNTLVPAVGGIYQLGTLAAASERRFLLVADFTSCLPDSIIAYSGWNCSGYPSSLLAYSCTPLKITLKETPLLPNLVTVAQGPSNSIALCEVAEYTVSIRNVQLGSAYNLTLNTTLPPGVSIVPGSSQLSYPSVNSFSVVANPTFISGTKWGWDISALNSNINSNGIKGIVDVGLNEVILRFQVIAGCGYTSGSSISFNTKAFAGCGAATGDEVALSSNLSITGADAPYETTIKLGGSKFITPCSADNILRVSIVNNGPLATQNMDSVSIVIPNGISIVPNSFVGIRNAPVNTMPTQYSLNSINYYDWKLPANVAIGDSVVFTFIYKGDPSILSCSTSEFKASTTVKRNLPCVTGSNCDVAVITGTTNLVIFSYKPYLSFDNGSATSTANVSNSEDVTVIFDIKNSGMDVLAGTPNTISYYEDTNNDGIYSAGDSYITNHIITAQIDSDGVYRYIHTLNIPAGKACNIIALLDNTINFCSCTSTQILLTPRLLNAGNDVFICSTNTTTLGVQSIAGYSYTWTPTLGLSNPNISNPTVSLTNTTVVTQTVSYVLETNRINCTTKDTVVVTIYPNPIISINEPTICLGQQTASLTANGATTYTWNTGETSSNVTQTPIVTTNYTVIGTDANGCTNTATTTVLVNTLPIVSATSSTICVGQQTATLTANGATTYTWNTGELTPNVTQTPTVTTDYIVTGTDANGCANTATATVLVNTLPTISVISSTICLGQQTATLSANGAVTYTWDNGATTSSIAVTPNATTQYTVVGEDSNGCLNANVVDAKVNPTPTATFVLSNACINSLVTLNNTSTVGAPDNITNVVWQFASGANISTSNDPLLSGVTFSTIGAHTIALTVSSNNGCSSTITNTVTIFPKPIASFSASSVCQASVTAFTDLSSVSSGIIVGWEWDFTADNTTDNTNQHPTFLYPSSGTYTAALISTTDNGCKDTVFNVVNVWGNSITDFVADTVCYGTITTFTNTTDVMTNSNIAGTISYSWEFGDGTVPSNQNNTTHLYNSVPNSNTTYTVKLTGTTTHGCINEKIKNVYIYAIPEASFIADSVCLGASTTFTDMSISNGNTLTNYTWDFLNNGSVSTFSNNISQFTYTAIGQHIVSYTVTTKPMSSLACKNSTIQSIWINPNPSPNFTANNACVNVQPINFDATSSNIATGSNTLYAWNFGDGNTGFNSITTHTYNVAQTYSVMLTVTSNKGCKTSITKQVNVYPKPIVTINTSTTTCFGKGTPLNVTTSSNSGTVVSWNWDINNSLNSIELTGQAVNHTFASAGSQTVNVITETNNGCKDTSSKVIYIDYLPVPLFSARNTKGCPELCTSFSDGTQTLVAPAINTIWEWDFGDGTKMTSNSSNSPVHCYDNTFANQVTNYSVKLTVTTDKGCKDSIVKPAFITLYPKPVAQFTANPNPVEVTNPLVEFTNQSTDFTKWIWDFDDGSDVDSINLNTNHVYQSLTAKDYSVTLIVSNNFKCTDTALVKVVVTPNYSFYIPNAFSPSDENDINDRFTGVGIGITEYEMWIYDRWGELLYYTNDITKGWDGKKFEKGDVLKQDVYVWKVNIRDVLKERHGYVGHVTLIR